MANVQLVADVSSWNPQTPAFFKELARRGVRAVIVKLTEGTTYQNPKAQAQIRAAWAAGLHVHGYHYAHYNTAAQAKIEATFFAATAARRGLNHTSALVADVEDAHLPQRGLTGLTGTFLTRLKQAGFPKVDVYTMASWVWAKRLQPLQLGPLNQWIANYGVNQPGVDRVGTWQFTSDWQHLDVDMSYDFKGFYTRI